MVNLAITPPPHKGALEGLPVTVTPVLEQPNVRRLMASNWLAMSNEKLVDIPPSPR